MRIDGWVRRRAVAVAASVLVAGAVPGHAAEAARPSEAAPPPRFADADRLAKLRAAFPEVDAAFRAFREERKVPGLAWGVIVDGALVHEGAAGTRDVATGAPAGRDSLFRIASMTKSFTALAILKLRDEGRLHLDEPASKYVPELRSLRYPTRDSPEITLRHLLSHSEGFPEDNPWGDRQLHIPDATLSAWMRAGIPFSNAPGVAYEYSNYGFSILGQVVARVSGRRYRDYVDREILQPLGMTSSRWEAASVPADRVAHGYRREDGRWVKEEPLADGSFGAMGGLYSTVDDLARYVSFHLAAWPPRDDDDRGPVRRASVREMQQVARGDRASARRSTVEAPLVLNAGGYGFGLRASETCRFRLSVAHSGGLPGYGSQMRWLPDHGVGIVALANLTYAAPSPAIAEAFEALAKTGALKPRVAQPAPALLAAKEGVDRLVNAWDDALYERLAADNLSLDVPRERRRQEMEGLRKALGSCRPDGAIAAENALRGEWGLACDRGRLRLSLTLAPTEPPKIQYLRAVSALPLSPGLERAVARLAERIGGGPTTSSTDSLQASGAVAAALPKTLSAAAAWGACRVGPTRQGGGDSATIRLLCDKGALDAGLSVDAEGAIASLTLTPSPTDTCAP